MVPTSRSQPPRTEQGSRRSVAPAPAAVSNVDQEEWPKSVPSDGPPDLLPLNIEATVLEAVRAWEFGDEYSVMKVDCDGYPCVVWVETTGGPDDLWQDELERLRRHLHSWESWETYEKLLLPLPRYGGQTTAARMGVALLDRELDIDRRAELTQTLYDFALNEPVSP